MHPSPEPICLPTAKRSRTRCGPRRRTVTTLESNNQTQTFPINQIFRVPTLVRTCTPTRLARQIARVFSSTYQWLSQVPARRITPWILSDCPDNGSDYWSDSSSECSFNTRQIATRITHQTTRRSACQSARRTARRIARLICYTCRQISLRLTRRMSRTGAHLLSCRSRHCSQCQSSCRIPCRFARRFASLICYPP